jgi:hypothetical protein
MRRQLRVLYNLSPQKLPWQIPVRAKCFLPLNNFQIYSVLRQFPFFYQAGG